ncbi:MAG TPA: hypothetical protein VKB80_24205 [Kofleriaceae bacterium]|nr:hypothetical protein [Kofleriaceae bacterium]
MVGGVSLAHSRSGHAQIAPEDPQEAAEDTSLPSIAIHGFVSQGAFLSTDNDYLGHSERGSVEFLEAAVNVQTQLTDKLRVGAQLFTRDLGPIGNYAMVLDWAYLDYRWRDWLGLRAGRIKMPFGLYNEFADVDAARLPILLPQSVYSIVDRDFLLAQTGTAIYGSTPLTVAGGIDYQAFGGTVFVDANSSALVVNGPVELDSVDTKYAAGGQLFWRAPLPGLRLGGSYLRTNLDFHFSTDAATAAALVATGMVPPDFDGTFTYDYRNINLAVGSVELARGDWLLSAEYSRWMFDVVNSVPMLLPEIEVDSERFYGMLAYRLTDQLEAGTYYSVVFADAGDRDGKSDRFTESHRAYQKDLAVSTRFDVNDFWLWKLEAHYMDGTAEVLDPDPMDHDDLARHWGFFLVKTTVTF